MCIVASVSKSWRWHCNLGREYQTLQIVTTRQTEHKWEKDTEAMNCNGCNVKFSVSVRKVCGGGGGIIKCMHTS